MMKREQLRDNIFVAWIANESHKNEVAVAPVECGGFFEAAYNCQRDGQCEHGNIWYSDSIWNSDLDSMRPATASEILEWRNALMRECGKFNGRAELKDGCYYWVGDDIGDTVRRAKYTPKTSEDNLPKPTNKMPLDVYAKVVSDECKRLRAENEQLKRSIREGISAVDEMKKQSKVVDGELDRLRTDNVQKGQQIDALNKEITLLKEKAPKTFEQMKAQEINALRNMVAERDRKISYYVERLKGYESKNIINDCEYNRIMDVATVLRNQSEYISSLLIKKAEVIEDVFRVRKDEPSTTPCATAPHSTSDSTHTSLGIRQFTTENAGRHLTKSQVRMIETMLEFDIPQQTIAQRAGVSGSVVSTIANGKHHHQLNNK